MGGRAGPRPAQLAFRLLSALAARRFASYSEDAQTLVERAFEKLGKHRDELTEAHLELAENVARRLYEIGLDHEALAGAVLRVGVAENAFSVKVLEEAFPAGVLQLLHGVGRMSAFGELGENRNQTALAQTERRKNLLLAIVKDVRVVIVELVDRLERLRDSRLIAAQARAQMAQATLDVYAPLASRLGIWQFKWELEDVAFRALEPGTYRDLARRLEARRSDREHYIEQAREILQRILAREGITGSISGRAKHIYGIARKMRSKGVGFEEIFDALALRVLVSDVASCYATLGHVHAQWTPIPAEFDDYIARPKGNGYQSLHTAVFGPDGKTIEIQIRTQTMHDQAEFGVAAHWRYKEGASSAGGSVEAKAAWLRQVLDWSETTDDALSAELDSGLLHDRVYVMTPRGEILDLPTGATPLDFAYQVHTDVGHRCRGAKVNGAMVPLTYRLVSGDRVDVLTTRNGKPSRDWLNPNLGYLNTPRARAKVRSWLKQQDYEQNKHDGLQAFNRELHRLGIEYVNRAALAPRFNLTSVDDLMAAIGSGDVSIGQINGALSQLLPRPEAPLVARKSTRATRGTNRGIEIQGVGNLLTTIAKCCHPVPPQRIVGYVTRGRGVSIHTQECGNVLRLPPEDRSRLIEVTWTPGIDDVYPVTVEIVAYDRQGLLRDITTVVSAENVNVAALDAGTKRSDETVRINITVEVRSLSELGRVVDRIHALSNVIEARAQPNQARETL